MARVELVHQRAGAAARAAARRRDVRGSRVLLQLGRRGERGGAEARAPLRARPPRRAQGARDLDAERVPRAHAVHGDRRRPGQVLVGLRAEPGRHHAHPVQRRRRAGSGVPRGRRRRRVRGHPRADAGRGRHDARHAGVPAGRAAPVHGAPGAADPRRDPERHGPHRRALLVHAEGHRSRHPDLGEGAGRRLPDRGDAHDRRDRQRVLGRRARHDLRRQPARVRGRGRRVRRDQHDRGARRREGAARAVHGRTEGDQRAPPRVPRPPRRGRVARLRARRALARQGVRRDAGRERRRAARPDGRSRRRAPRALARDLARRDPRGARAPRDRAQSRAGEGVGDDFRAEDRRESA